ncbi:MAG TPA: glycosyltransferase [Xanthomonadaceae bacterium]|nr:glycosyltransferase [Xanthomonadaceae bacterium]
MNALLATASTADERRPPETGTAAGTLSIVVLGLTLRSSWGNGHATTYRALIRALVQRGHRVLFLERDKPWYAISQDHEPLPGEFALYDSLEQLERDWRRTVERADLVVVGSFVPEGVRVGDWACATPIISDAWRGLEAFFEPGKEILVARDADDVLRWLRELPEGERRRIGEAARRRVLRDHTAARRAEALEGYVLQARVPKPMEEA